VSDVFNHIGASMGSKGIQVVSIEAISQRFCVRPSDGRLVYRVGAGPRKAGAEAGSKNSQGYWQVKVMGQNFLAHRVVWALTHGAWPEIGLDHRNRIETDNRPSNLRLATTAINSQNRICNNKCGFPGVAICGNKFQARIRINGRYTHLGSFSTAEAAHGAYIEAKKKFHPGFAH
jgi:hypothetical protein